MFEIPYQYLLSVVSAIISAVIAALVVRRYQQEKDVKQWELALEDAKKKVIEFHINLLSEVIKHTEHQVQTVLNRYLECEESKLRLYEELASLRREIVNLQQQCSSLTERCQQMDEKINGKSRKSSCCNHDQNT